ncbi:hypothetical protein, partial [Serratia nevei]|uniref:hypothetical protein n=1 Tax=Serratia nevei TaxID=2703794 RepID=UPI00254C2F22
RHRSVRLVILVGLAIDQIAQSGLSSLSVIYYSAQLFSSTDGDNALGDHPADEPVLLRVFYLLSDAVRTFHECLP